MVLIPVYGTYENFIYLLKKQKTHIKLSSSLTGGGAGVQANVRQVWSEGGG